MTGLLDFPTYMKHLLAAILCEGFLSTFLVQANKSSLWTKGLFAQSNANFASVERQVDQPLIRQGQEGNNS